MAKYFIVFSATLLPFLGSNWAKASETPGSLRALQFGTCTTLTNVKVECNSATSTDQNVSFNVAGGLKPYKVTITCDSNQAIAPLTYYNAGDQSTVIPYCAGAITVSAKGRGFCQPSVVKIDAANTPDCCYNDIRCNLDPSKVVDVAGCSVMVVATMFPPTTAVSDIFTVNAAACRSTELALTFDRTQTPVYASPAQYCPDRGGVSVRRTYHVTPYDRTGAALTASRVDCAQNFLVKHTTPPKFYGSCATSTISNITIGCDTKGPIDFTLPTGDCHAKGACSNFDVPVVFDASLEGSVLHRTWTATDLCGNNNYKTQDITLTDTGC